MPISHIRSVLVVLAVVMTAPTLAEAQFGRIIRGTAEAEARRRTSDAVRDTIRCTTGDDKCVEDAKKDGKDVVVVDSNGDPVVDADGNPVTDPDEAEKLAQEPGEGVWRNYDFTPGKNVLYVTDFSDERVGRFPSSQLGFGSGNGQIVEVQELGGKKMLETSASTIFTISLPEALPEGFSLEFFVKTSTPNGGLDVYFGPPPPQSQRDGQYLRLGQSPGIYSGGTDLSSMGMNGGLAHAFHEVKLQVDGDYAVLYVGSERVANLPAAKIVGSDVITFHMGGGANYRGYISDFVVAAGLDRFSEALIESGEFTTRGIYFDTDSDVIRPESTPTLEDIRSTLSRDSDLSVVIEGHTDNQGEEDYNADLSERRARSVIAYLTANGVADSQLAAAGKGETEPVADNSTAEGRAENRRVVLKRAEG